MIVFDFDRVLFDTDRFITCLDEAGLGDLPRDETLVEAVEKAGINWADFLNPEVLDYLQEHGSNCAIVSSYISRNRLDNDFEEAGLAHFQLEKIKRSGLDELVSKVVVTGAEKELALSGLAEEHADLVLVDDEREHLSVAKQLGYDTVLFRTFHNSTQGPESIENREFRSIGSFAEFAELKNE